MERKQPTFPLGPNGPTFHDLREGDRVRVTRTGRTGVIVRRCKPARDGWIVRWDEPVFGVEQGRVAWVNLEPAADHATALRVSHHFQHRGAGTRATWQATCSCGWRSVKGLTQPAARDAAEAHRGVA